MGATPSRIIPYLFVDDVAEYLDFLARAFGFEARMHEVDPGDPEREPFDGEAYPAIDVVGAGEGEVVLVAIGSAARIPTSTGQTPTDASVVAIVDSVIVGGEVTFKK